ncbi:hypothetical protein HMP09_3333 [Sphingomonas sp. HMP9]|uniref:hypothetical protein n=1 Tax=Sphingomonas sp. HMP9 TaxID=1517554 RepID=UPI001596D0D3|nr:hypothetical protein [Sphingomonas sp. HMP9]BCA64099.1 hypothetical protein HMP09_3333 [Sphingomonas sp. HMP9]
MAKAKTIKIPKTIGGVKLPKELRKTGNALLEKANSPEGRQVIASGMAMFATAAMAARSQAAKAPAPEPAAAPAPAPAAPSAADATADAKAAPSPAADAARGAAAGNGPKACGELGTQNPQNIDQVLDAIGTAAEAALKRVFGGKLGK